MLPNITNVALAKYLGGAIFSLEARDGWENISLPYLTWPLQNATATNPSKNESLCDLH